MIRVLHILPHAGAGAQTYIDVLAGLDGYEFELFELSASRSATAAAMSIVRRQPALLRAARAAHLVHVHGEVASLITLPLLKARASVVTLHGLHLLRRLRPGGPRRLGQAGVHTIVAASDRTICVSQAELADLRWLAPRAFAKLALVRNGLPPAPEVDQARRSEVRIHLGLKSDVVAVLYAGQLEPRKDPMTALRAAVRAHSRDPRIVFLIAGDGPCRDELARWAGPETRLLGQRHDVDQLLAAADVFVMPSLREGLSYAVLEALARGVATVVSDGAGNPEAVGDAGLVFTAGDDVALAELLVELAEDSSRRRELGDRGRARVRTELSAEQMLAGTRAVYDSVIQGA
jgi:glycosyltransferase involved in cell wall biosynthesis